MEIRSFVSGNQTIDAELYLPSTGTAFPCVTVLYGTEGMRDPFGELIRSFCNELVAKGIAAFVPDYFSSTGTSPGMKTVFSPTGATTRFDRWDVAITDALKHLPSINDIDATRLAVVGFSLGGHLAIRVAAAQNVKCAIDFFGPVATIGSTLSQSSISGLRSIQIHHGESDQIVSIQDSLTIEGWLQSNLTPYELHRYSQSGHPGQEAISPPGWDSQSHLLSTTRSIQFLTDNL